MSKLASQVPQKLPPRPKQLPFKPEDYARSNVPFNQIQQLKEAFDLFDIARQGRIDPKGKGLLTISEIKNALNACNM
jgi:Ca2+-binding EF-hand superfamily protein